MFENFIQLNLAGVVLSFGILEHDLYLSHVLICLLELARSLLALLSEAAYTRGFLEDIASVLGLHEKDLVDLSLLQDAVGGFANSGIHEKLTDVPKQAFLAIDIVFVVSVSECTPLDLDLSGVDVQDALFVVHGEDDLAHGHGLALVGSVEDHILALAGSESAQRLRSQDPLDRIDYIALSAAVGAQKRCYAVGEFEFGPVREGFEAVELD